MDFDNKSGIRWVCVNYIKLTIAKVINCRVISITFPDYDFPFKSATQDESNSSVSGLLNKSEPIVDGSNEVDEEESESGCSQTRKQTTIETEPTSIAAENSVMEQEKQTCLLSYQSSN